MNQRLRRLVADPAERRPSGTGLRGKQREVFRRHFLDIENMRLLDLGGTIKHWETSPMRHKLVGVLKLLPEATDTDWIKIAQGDACDTPGFVPDAARRR